MGERVKKVTVFVKDKWTGFSTAVKIMVAAIPVALIAIIIILAILLNHKDEATLYSGLTSTEAGEIVAIIQEQGVTGVRTTASGDIIVPVDRVDDLRMSLLVAGYPKNASNYDIWNDGVDLWSTDTDKREVMRQQREQRIATTLSKLDPVAEATAILEIPQTPNYVITSKDEEPRVSVTLKLRGNDELTNAEVRAIFRLIETSVDGLTIDNISVVDTQGRPYEWVSEEEEKSGAVDASGINIARRRQQFTLQITEALKADLKEMMSNIFGPNGYTLNVAADLDFDIKRVESTEYFPVEGTNTGVANHEDHVIEWIDGENSGGLVGVTPNGDLSPDYPTIDGLVDGESYYYRKDEIQYDVTNIKTYIEKNGYEIKSLSVGLAINSGDLTAADREDIERMVAKAANTDVENVAVWNTVFSLDGVAGGGSTAGGDFTGVVTRPVDTYRNILLFVVIALGIILVILLIASLFVSRSRKKKIIKRQEAAAAASAQYAGVMGTQMMDETPGEVDFNIASLTEEAGKESRETILKREISEFAKTNPEIVASIIKNMLKEDA
ncbi:MAG: flagellar M-ring protein FliF [Oscillospiraceae bacterium]|nr:flagellar M-ring protein FliF [Oscillospiraceae bacterium]